MNKRAISWQQTLRAAARELHGLRIEDETAHHRSDERSRRGRFLVLFHPPDDNGGESLFCAWLADAVVEDNPQAAGAYLADTCRRARARLVGRASGETPGGGTDRTTSAENRE